MCDRNRIIDSNNTISHGRNRIRNRANIHNRIRASIVIDMCLFVVLFWLGVCVYVCVPSLR